MNRKAGDWNCRSCQHLNFSRRDSCQRCGDQPIMIRSSGAGGNIINSDSCRNVVDYASCFGGSRPGAAGSSLFGGGFASGSDVRPGDWYCACGGHNFASRSSCFRCGAFKDESSAGAGFEGGTGADAPRPRSSYGFGSGSSRAGWKSGDWICTRNGCNEHNFASRMECFRCNAPRDSGTEA